MIFATANSFDSLGVIFFGMLVVCFFWLIYMATCKPQILADLYKIDRERRDADLARRKVMAKGGVNLLMLLFKLFKR